MEFVRSFVGHWSLQRVCVPFQMHPGGTTVVCVVASFYGTRVLRVASNLVSIFPKGTLAFRPDLGSPLFLFENPGPGQGDGRI